ncbi:methyltransferase domain-containing protein [Thiorhodococcus mannitoliphagus]|uniref:Methyltransferase domain-containing protein n=1 Tax=Thiorhodococcus mannitoliphagus TaxID=329406 RepID=A0A6P1E0Y1_9GAMM|nr:methyltransferase domain-containing protein [Thiorhodococcus mannitoliphagus]NEX22706.1 methyltransferase domain-containing protein [Thiorhodococcus mannitoliphagus]
MLSIERLIEARWRSPKTEALEQIRKADWTSHNIPLTAQSATLPGPDRPLIGDEPRTRAIRQCMDLLLGPGPEDGEGYRGRLVDLGCLEGGLSFEMARAGFDVLGVEGRESNYQRCQLIEHYYALPNLRFEHLDVKNLSPERHGRFDAVVCCGLFYHLDDPVDFLHLLAALTHDRSALFLDTHIAPPDDTLDECVFRESLSDYETVQHHGESYSGRWYDEYPEGGHSDDAWASVSNYRSFWLTKDALITALEDAGFGLAYELYGTRPAREEADLKRKFSRIYLMAVKRPYFSNPKTT